MGGRMLASSWLVAVLALVIGPAAAHASLPGVASGQRPGPDVLYAPPPEAPQLQNLGIWSAEPILVSGAHAYRDGEFLYQDFLHDDRGLKGIPDPGDPHGPGDFLFSPKAGTVSYPTDPVFANNAADLVELRVRPLADATAFRVTLNTLQDAERTAFTIALGTSEQARAWPHGAGVRSPAEQFLTVHGATAELRDAATGAVRAPAPEATVDLERRQVEVRVPHTAWDPGTSTVRMAAGVGLWDPGAGSYLAPRLGQATASAPGGGIPGGAALFNVAFRFDEPFPDVGGTGAGITIGDAAVGGMVDASWWREREQAFALSTGDVSKYYANVDFAKLAAGTDDDAGVPKTGPINRIMASRFAFGQGVDHRKVCFDVAGGAQLEFPCDGRFVGQLQPYALYVPAKARPDGGWGLTLLLHSLSANYNQYSASKNQSQLGERGAGTLVATPSGRGPDGFYTDIAEADTFEVWADVARHYDLDPDWAVVSGYSMGGFGTYRLLARWPDLFARGMATVASADDLATLPSLRNTPVMAWAAALDELVPVTDTEETARALGRAGLRFVADLFPAADHLTLATNDEYGRAARFLGEHRVDRDPPHVTYVVAPATDSPRAGAVADHAYWLSGLTVRGTDEEDPHGTIDARSEGFGLGEPPLTGVTSSAGTLNGGSRGPLPFVRRRQRWGPPPERPEADRLVVRATNVATATVDARRARLSCAPMLDVRSDGPLDLRIACPPAPRARSCPGRLRIAVPRVEGRRVVDVRVTRNGRTLKHSRGRDVRRVVVRRPSRKAFALRIRARTSGGPRPQRVTVVRRYRACPRNP